MENFQVNESTTYQLRVDRIVFYFHWSICDWIFNFDMIKHIITQTLGMFVFKTENLAERQIPLCRN